MPHSSTSEDSVLLPTANTHRETIASDQLRLLFDYLPSGQLITLFNASILLYVVSDTVNTSVALAWLSVVVTTVLYRFALLIAFRFSHRDRHSTDRWLMAFNSGALAMGSVWGAAALWASQSADIVTHMFMGFVLGGMAAGALSTLAINFNTYLLFLVPSLVPFIVGLFASRSEPDIGMGIMVTLFLVGLYSSGKRYNRALLDSLTLRYENVDLIDELRNAILKVEEASAEKSLFLASVSHEIRTPMNGVLGMSNLLKRTRLSDRQRRLVDTVHQSADSLLSIINDTLDICQIDAGKYQLDSTEFDLRACVEDAAALLADEAERKGVEFIVFTANNIPSVVKGDPVRLRQICINLIGNAIKFTDEGTVSVHVTVDKPADGEPLNVKIKIDDTGIGMDTEMLSRIQAPFIQADSSISRRFGGTGLGLSVTKQIVELMGGSVEITSELGRGTHVTATVALQVIAKSLEDARKSSGDLGGKKLLVVGQHKMLQEVLRQYLNDCGASVSCASSPAEALISLQAAALNDEPYAAAVCDLGAAGIDGIELTRQIKTDDTIADVSIVIITPIGWDGDAGEVIESGVAEILIKPVRRHELCQTVMRQLATTELQIPGTNDDGEPEILPQYSGHVLIVEDNPVNQEVARQHLESFGCTAEIAHDGMEAVDKVRDASFNLILMDVQMPRMDGFAATKKIRELEGARGSCDTPIVALTANPLEGERQTCLDVGMNGCVGKPFSEQDLEQVLAKWLVPAVPVNDQSGCVNKETLSRIHGQKPELVRRIISLYLNHAIKMISELKAGIENADHASLNRTAHSLKSSSSNIGAKKLTGLCENLERISERQQMSDASAIVLQIVVEFEKVRWHLNKHAKEFGLVDSRKKYRN